MSQSDIEIGSKIRKVRLDKGITQKQMANLMGVSQTAIALWENGNRSISIETLRKFSVILGVEMMELLPEDNDDNKAAHNEKINVVDFFKGVGGLPDTIAAHFDGDEFTEDELNEIRQFAAFVKSKRNKT